MKLNKEWEKEIEEIEVPREKVLEAIEKGLGAKEITEKKQTFRLTKKLVTYFKNNRVMVLAMLAILIVGGVTIYGMQNGNDVQQGMNSNFRRASDSEKSTEKQEVAAEPDYPTSSGELQENEQKSLATEESKMIKTYSVDIETRKFTKDREKIKNEIQKSDGNISDSIEEQNSEYRIAHFTVNVPKDKADSFVNSVEKIGKATYSASTSEDHTLAYTDNEGRIVALLKEEEALLKVLEESKSVSDTISIQERLAVIRGDKESLIRQNKLIDSQVEYSTINLTLTEVVKESVELKKNSFEQIQENWREKRENWRRRGKNLVVFLGSNLAYLVIIVVVSIAGIILYQKKRNK